MSTDSDMLRINSLGLDMMQDLADRQFSYLIERDNGNVHRAAAKVMQAEKPARPAAPCATYCYHAICVRSHDPSLLVMTINVKHVGAINAA